LSDERFYVLICEIRDYTSTIQEEKMTIRNPVKEQLKAGKPTIGVFVITAHPTIAEVLAVNGFDWLVFDMEHGVIGIESVEMMAQAISSTQALPVVRVPWNDFIIIKQVLDTGVMGLIIPMVNNAKQAQMAIKATRYPPEGIRGIGPHRASAYGKTINQYFREANENILVVIQIEHFQAVENIESILTVSGIDCVFIGAQDLAASMGFLGNPAHPDVQKSIDRVLNACRKANIPCGLVAAGSDIDKRIKEGFQFIAVGHDVSLLNSACKNVFSQIKCLKKDE